MGSNTDGVLGLGSARGDQFQTSPQKIKGLHEVTAVSAGKTHNLAVDTHGKVYGWGCTSSGAIGVQLNMTQVYPQVIKMNGKRITQAVCGGSHSILVTDQGQAFGLGSN
jgi:alpha-tubulin suppressor-like RCC1 family protein